MPDFLPSFDSFERNRYQRDSSHLLQSACLGASVVVGGLALYAGITSAIGAAEGAIGHSVLSASDWHNSNFTLGRSANASVVGSVISGFVPMSIGVCLGALGLVKTGAARGLVLTAVTGAAYNLLGATVLKYLPSHDPVDLGYSAAVGATGSAILVSGIVVVGLMALCCGGCYLVSEGLSGEVNLLEIPARDITAENEISSLENGRLVSLEAVLGRPLQDLNHLAQILADTRTRARAMSP